ncbi:hypothetical protein HDU91_001467, partial [Kappamyces sp. JEL0680]
MTHSQVFAIGGKDAKGVLELVEIPRRAVGANDVAIEIKYCGMCHSDLHHTKNEWGAAPRPAVPGHEIIGHVTSVGASVTKFKVGDAVGVGCFVDSCRKCPECTHPDALIQYCSGTRQGDFPGLVGTYGAPLLDVEKHTKGGYSQAIVVDENYVLNIPSNLDLAAAAPLLCAGITVWSPIVHYGIKAGDEVAVLGLGGLGHMAVKFAHALGANVTVLSRSRGKEEEARRLGASSVVITSDAESFKKAARSFNFVIDTVSAKHDLGAYLNLLKTD